MIELYILPVTFALIITPIIIYFSVRKVLTKRSLKGHPVSTHILYSVDDVFLDFEAYGTTTHIGQDPRLKVEFDIRNGSKIYYDGVLMHYGLWVKGAPRKAIRKIVNTEIIHSLSIYNHDRKVKQEQRDREAAQEAQKMKEIKKELGR